MFSLVLAAGLLAASASAQRPSNTSVCDYYTTALLKDNNATNQETLITLLVNTAVIGNSTPTTANIKVPGILAANQTYNGTAVNLLPYFDGSLKSSNRGGESGVSINFLDDGAAVPIAKGKPADGESSNQYKLITHLYAYFGILLGCSKYSQPGFPAYNGAISMYKVHKFMALDPYDFGFFVQQVALSAASYGVALADLEIVGDQLYEAFGYRCSALNTFVPESQPALQSICITDDCLIEGNSTCSLYAKVQEPKRNGSATVTGTHHPSATSAATATSSKKSGADMTKTRSGSLVVIIALAAVCCLL
ncbi:hypothetical protein LTR53_000627 [Teratosphaeriaceae sp. CCFEE 6253]|nr:hypothetical protein LTR53_000627 [Teratosphaeriaceae sp. CCFEE 6253]